MLRNGVAIVACIAVAVMALQGQEPAPPGTPPGPVELAVAEERLSVADRSAREPGAEPRRAAVRRYEAARRDRKRRDGVRRRPQTSRPSSHGVRAVAGVADPAQVVRRAGTGSPGAGGDERVTAHRAPSAGGQQRPGGARPAPRVGGQQRPSGAAPRAPRQDASGDGNAPAPAPPPPPPPAAPSVNTGVDEPADDVVSGPAEAEDDAGEIAPDD